MDSHTLDPEDWDRFEKLGKNAISEMMNYLRTVRSRKVWQEIPDTVKSYFSSPVPYTSTTLEELYEDIKRNVLPYPPGNIHPRFWGWVNGTGTAQGILAELITATMNVNSGGRNHVSNFVETQVVKWMVELFGFKDSASGVLTSGCSEANLLGLTIARNARAQKNVREEGLQEISSIMRFYGSEQMHSSIQKACEIIGIGSSNLRLIPTNEDYTINIDKLINAIIEDIDQGFHPVCLIGNAGTVNSGAFDDLIKLRQIADRFSMTFHVDGAFGSLVRLSSHADLVRGIEKADSLAFDFHKWLHVQYDVGMLLVATGDDHRASFSLRPSYLESLDFGIAKGGMWFSDLGIQLSRSFRALKVWLHLKLFGIDALGALVDQNIDQANYFVEKLSQLNGWEILAPVQSNIVCFRYVDSKHESNAINKNILREIYTRNDFIVSYTTLDDKFCLRLAITNHRTRRSDLDVTIKILDEIISSVNLE